MNFVRFSIMKIMQHEQKCGEAGRSVLKYEVTLGSRIFFRNERRIVAIVNV